MRGRLRVVMLVAAALSLVGPSLAGRDGATETARPARPSAAAPAVSLDRLPLLFVENRGQTDPRAAFYGRGRDLDVFFTDRGLVFALGRPGARHAVRAEFDGAAPVAPAGSDFAETIVSYFRGPRAEWKTGLRTLRAVTWRGVWPGIDLAITAEGDRLKSLWTVAPGADPARIATLYAGAGDVRVTDAGDLVVSTPAGDLVDGRPVAWQVGPDGAREPVAAAWDLRPAAPQGAFRAGFALAAHDPARVLYIDPVVLTYSGFLGGTATMSKAIAADAFGCAYVVGTTFEAAPTFPATVGPDTTYNDNPDAFVAKVNAEGTGFVYAGYIGGASGDEGFGIAVDSSGSAYVVGTAYSNESSFPVLTGPDLTFNGSHDAFIAKVAPGGNALQYCGYVGGSGPEQGYAVAVDASGNAYITGTTLSSEATFPVLGGPDVTYGGGIDAFVAKVSAGGTALSYAGYIGGGSFDEGRAIAVEPATGIAYVVGSAQSSEASFPVLGGPDLTYNGGYDDAYVVRVKADGSGFLWAGYLGGTNEELAYGVVVAPGGTIVVAGRTHSDATGFPAVGGPDLTLNGDWDTFVTKLDATSAAIVWSGFVGGSDQEYVGGLAIDSVGDLYVAGYTHSMDGTYPVSVGPDTMPAGYADVFVTKVLGDGSGLGWSGFLGGGGWESTGDTGIVAASSGGGVFVTGQPGAADEPPLFPTVTGPTLGTESATFVVKISETLGSLGLNLAKGSLKDSTKAGGDSVKVSGTFTPPPGYEFDPRGLPAEIWIGDASAPLIIAIPAGPTGYKTGKGKLQWKGTQGSLKMDFVKGTFSVTAAKATFGSLPANPMRVRIDLGGQVFDVKTDWTEDPKKPGNFKYP